MSAEVLRRAASLMRERAEAATPPPWHVDYRQHVYAALAAPQVRYDAPSNNYTTAVAPMVWDRNAEHIASWHPAVALAVADWLDDTADRLDDDLATYRPDRTRYDSTEAWVERNYRQPLAVARAYLGES
jgi:hypothetical protein